ncbi:hypothetical protein [Actinacidiphila oryziradicis]|uniref:Uncharacterized protein n=1 Tax=Actinacidiphila oryziradicis TaxID=2571141 RepID=A0A4U0SEB1_9ACTN|nr:hypothetical protein [Actinacidiphila oryziradicis]TKA06507.1 hypothetical protein FCI23_30990 [Actinacidiphila oryziradicis]
MQAKEMLRDLLRAAAQSAAPDETGAAISQAEGADLHLEVSVEQLGRFRDIAAHVGMSVETWAAHTLDSASRRPGA